MAALVFFFSTGFLLAVDVGPDGSVLMLVELVLLEEPTMGAIAPATPPTLLLTEEEEEGEEVGKDKEVLLGRFWRGAPASPALPLVLLLALDVKDFNRFLCSPLPTVLPF